MLIETGWVDPDRIGIIGGSYGGYLTAWVVAHDHRFKAAVAQRGVYDLVTFFGEGGSGIEKNARGVYGAVLWLVAG